MVGFDYRVGHFRPPGMGERIPRGLAKESWGCTAPLCWAYWLAPEMILRLAVGDPEVGFDLEEVIARSDAHRPFDHPYFWGVF